MIEPEHNPVALLKLFNKSRGTSVDAGVRLMYTHLDGMPGGYTAAETIVKTGINRQTAIGARSILQDYGCLYASTAPKRTGVRGSSKLWLGTELLADIAAEYNAFIGDLMSTHLPGKQSPQQVRATALGRLARGYSLEAASNSEAAILQAAQERGLGHPHSVVYRALASMAVTEQVDLLVRNDVQSFL